MSNTFMWTSLCFLVMAACSRLDRPVKRPFYEYDSLGFLVNAAEAIAVVRVERDLAPQSVNYVPVTVLTPVKGSMLSGEEFNLYLSPCILPTDVAAIYFGVNKGEYLVFLCSHEGGYAPVTDHSLIEVLRDRVFPIWLRERSVKLQLHNSEPIVNVLDDISSVLRAVGKGL